MRVTRLVHPVRCMLCICAMALSPIAAEQPKAAPQWAQEEAPAWVQKYLGKSGLPAPWPDRPGLIGEGTAGIDLWQANHFVAYRAETAKYLYEQYTPLKVQHTKGTLPEYEKQVEKFTGGAKSDREKALALLKTMPQICRHPSIPPLGPSVPADRAMDDRQLIESKTGWCNEQARVYVRLCQVAGIPARMIFLFYEKCPSGHVIAEFYADGRWCMADSSWLCVFPFEEGPLMSAAEAHSAEGKALAMHAYRRRWDELLKLRDDELDEKQPGAARRMIQSTSAQPPMLWAFGVMNYPLPR